MAEDVKAKLEFAPGTKSLKCAYCGGENSLQDAKGLVTELDFYDYFARASEDGESEEKQVVKCSSCNAESTVDKNISTSKCPFCGSQLTARARGSRLIKPGAVLPFKVPQNQAVDKFRSWLGELWFAPGELKRQAGALDGIRGMYLPYWTYDARTATVYNGERGENYYETESYEDQDEKGNRVTRSRQVVRTRWYSSSGSVNNRFDDVLVLAGRSLPQEIIQSLQPWDLKNLVPYQDEYMSGFQAEAYQIDLGAGFEEAKAIMDEGIRRSIERDIGGDQQRIHAARTEYDGITFKHVLLPVWISAYRYRGKSYRFIVNARTGQAQGERPWSVFKIVTAVIAFLTVLLIVALLLKH
jgi:predicted RNA-binding Zn-ribbon protein involved in translation (DUF1610 family)